MRSWYPAGVSSGEARLRYYAERFDAVEADSPFYRLPAPGTAAKWAARTPPGFTFFAKASGEMTGHRETDDRERAFRDFREALAPLEEAGKLRGVLLQYGPRFERSRAAEEEVAAAGARVAPLVALVEFRHASWFDELERTLAFLRRHGLAHVSIDGPVFPRVAAATHAVAYVRFHGRNRATWYRRTRTSAERFDWLYAREELAGWVEPLRALAGEAEEVYAMFNNNRGDQAPRSARILRDLLDEAGLEATGAEDPAATLF